MTFTQLLADQLTDPLRLGLTVALVAVLLRNRDVTAFWLPLAAGVLFIALLLPLTTARGGAAPFAMAVAVGLLSTALLLALVLGIRHVVLRWMA